MVETTSHHHNMTGFGFLLSETSRTLRRRFEQKAQDYNLTSAQWRAIVEVSRQEGMTQVALAQRLEIEPMTVCRLIDRMEAAGFVSREPDPADKRAKLVRLTDHSKGIIDKMREIAHFVYEEAFDGFTDDERIGLVAALKRINANLSDKVAERETENA